VLLIIGVHFRSAVAPLVVFATVGIAVVVARGLVDLGSGATGITVPGELEPLIVVLLLGVVADYGIFFLDSMRSALASEHDVRRAAIEATARTCRWSWLRSWWWLPGRPALRWRGSGSFAPWARASPWRCWWAEPSPARWCRR